MVRPVVPVKRGNGEVRSAPAPFIGARPATILKDVSTGVPVEEVTKNGRSTLSMAFEFALSTSKTARIVPVESGERVTAPQHTPRGAKLPAPVASVFISRSTPPELVVEAAFVEIVIPAPGLAICT
jgi:hypothetical protein